MEQLHISQDHCWMWFWRSSKFLTSVESDNAGWRKTGTPKSILQHFITKYFLKKTISIRGWKEAYWLSCCYTLCILCITFSLICMSYEIYLIIGKKKLESCSWSICEEWLSNIRLLLERCSLSWNIIGSCRFLGTVDVICVVWVRVNRVRACRIQKILHLISICKIRS